MRAKESESSRSDPTPLGTKGAAPRTRRSYNVQHRPGESPRVFPLSNWTELDIWQYIHREQIPIVPLYLAAPRPVVDAMAC
nr:phosphoadenosine phosphosulfate reductase family protein [Candidatus Microthrix sp.]